MAEDVVDREDGCPGANRLVTCGMIILISFFFSFSKNLEIWSILICSVQVSMIEGQP